MSFKVIIEGIITDIFPAEIIKNFEKRVIWVTEPDTTQYPNQYQLELHQNDCNIADKFKPGDKVRCHIDLRGRKWTKDGKEFITNTLKCWRIENLTPQPSIAQKYAASQQANAYSAYSPTDQPPVDDLPF